MPEVEVARMEDADARIGNQEGHALVRGAERRDLHAAKALRLARLHAHAAIRLRHVKAHDVHGVLAAQIVNRFGKMVVVAMADKHIELAVCGQRFLPGQNAPVRAVLARVKEKSGFADRHQKAAASQVFHCNVLHRAANAPFLIPSSYMRVFCRNSSVTSILSIFFHLSIFSSSFNPQAHHLCRQFR